MITAITTEELAALNKKCKGCKYWVTLDAMGFKYPYCKKINSDSAIFRINRCNGRFRDE